MRGREGGERSLIGSGKSGKSLTKNGSKSECGNDGDTSGDEDSTHWTRSNIKVAQKVLKKTIKEKFKKL